MSASTFAIACARRYNEGRSKRLYADLSLDHELPKEVLKKNDASAHRKTHGWLK